MANLLHFVINIVLRRMLVAVPYDTEQHGRFITGCRCLMHNSVAIGVA